LLKASAAKVIADIRCKAEIWLSGLRPDFRGITLERPLYFFTDLTLRTPLTAEEIAPDCGAGHRVQ